MKSKPKDGRLQSLIAAFQRIWRSWKKPPGERCVNPAIALTSRASCLNAAAKVRDTAERRVALR
jgi:hypothetical protein